MTGDNLTERNVAVVTMLKEKCISSNKRKGCFNGEI